MDGTRVMRDRRHTASARSADIEFIGLIGNKLDVCEIVCDTRTAAIEGDNHRMRFHKPNANEQQAHEKGKASKTKGKVPNNAQWREINGPSVARQTTWRI